MPNTSSAKKAIRASKKKRDHNLFWKGRIRNIQKNLTESLEEKDVDKTTLNNQLSAFQKVLDKSAKENVISKNKANRLKSRYAHKISAKVQEPSDSRKEQKQKSK